MAVFYIALGSNIEPEENILAALRLLSRQIHLLAVSNLYRTRPLDRPEQPNFINGVIAAESEMPPQRLKALLRQVEEDLGRVRTEDKHAARPIDLDMVAWDGPQVAEPELSLPDPQIAARVFLLVPLAELAPELHLPDQSFSLQLLAAQADRCGLVLLQEFTFRVQEEIRLEH